MNTGNSDSKQGLYLDIKASSNTPEEMILDLKLCTASPLMQKFWIPYRQYQIQFSTLWFIRCHISTPTFTAENAAPFGLSIELLQSFKRYMKVGHFILEQDVTGLQTAGDLVCLGT